ncbi:MAG: class I adenylate-forming enzyme family protein [candidate division Zixibacteria bacterium]
MKLIDILKRGGATSPNKIAITHGDNSISYRDLIGTVVTLSEYLKSSQIPAGSCVSILYENSIEYIVSFFAITAADLIPVPLDTSLKPDKFNFILHDCGAKGLIIQKKYTRHIDRIIDSDSPVELVISDRKMDLSSLGKRTELLSDILGNSEIKTDFESFTGDMDNKLPNESLTHTAIGNTPHELAAIFYTSGSTGTPKGVMLSHRNLLSNTLTTVEYLELTSDDSIIVILPFYYIYGNSLLLTHILAGGRVVIDNRFAFPQVVLETMAEEKVTGFSGVPSNFMILLNNPNFSSDKFPALRYLTQAGGAMAPEVIRKVMNVFSGKQIFIMYGQTEASPRVTYLPLDMLEKNVGSIGIPLPGVTVQIIGENGQEVPIGDVGEIVVSGDCVMMGYRNQPEEQAEVLKDGKLFTGDLARRDENGLIYIVSRKKEIIKVGGNRVSAREVEEKLLEHPGVSEAAIIGVSDEILGEAIKAIIVIKENQSIETKEIQDFCKAHLAMHKVPKYVEFLDALPKYQSGKINKQALNEM